LSLSLGPSLSFLFTKKEFRPLKRKSSANFRSTYGGLVHTSRFFLTSLARSFTQISITPSSLFYKKEGVMFSAPLCSCSGTNSPHRIARSCQSLGHKKTRVPRRRSREPQRNKLAPLPGLGLLSLNRLLSLLDV